MEKQQLRSRPAQHSDTRRPQLRHIRTGKALHSCVCVDMPRCTPGWKAHRHTHNTLYTHTPTPQHTSVYKHSNIRLLTTCSLTYKCMHIHVFTLNHRCGSQRAHVCTDLPEFIQTQMCAFTVPWFQRHACVTHTHSHSHQEHTFNVSVIRGV